MTVERNSDPRVIDGVGLWFEHHGRTFEAGRPALLLDRDGVIVEETHYLGRAEDVRMIPAAARTIKWANDAGLPVVVVTNQAGIGRGYYDWTGFDAVQSAIMANLAAVDARVDLVVACAYHERALGPFAIGGHAWRKPNPGMIEAASAQFKFALDRSLIVGDRSSDLEAGRAAGVGFGVHVESGHGRDERKTFDPTALRPMRVGLAPDIGTATEAARAIGWLS